MVALAVVLSSVVVRALSTLERTPMNAIPRDFLERNTRTRIALIRDLAEGTMTPARLGEKYGASREAIRDFAKRHKDDIEYAKSHLEDKLLGLWVASKQARIAEYQDDIELTNAEIAAAREGRLGVFTTDADGNVTWERIEDLSDVIGRLLRGKHRALRSVAEERGELPSRIALHVEDADKKVTHVLKGVDMDKL
jgi:hypothetical protein